jgi:FAD/FMN-containing dehydrogenase
MDKQVSIPNSAASADAVGFDTVSRNWVASVDARRPPSTIVDVPPLDGALYTDIATRTSASTDMGSIVHQLPAAVLRPGSVEDVQKMVAFCRAHRIPVAARGQHHTMHGQGLTPGLIVEMKWLKRVHSIEPTRVVVDAGITWTALIEETFRQGLRPRGLPGFTGLSIGGTLSVGGCPMTNHAGGLVDSVRALQVVTGRGELVECSETQERELFEALLGGLGQCGIITRATIDLVPALPRARTYWLNYADARQYFDDFRTLVDRDEMNDCYTMCVPPGAGSFVYQIQATVFFDPSAPPDDAHLLRGLAVPPEKAFKLERSYFEYATEVEQQIAMLEQVVGFDGLVKPWYDVWLPEDAVEKHVTETLANVTMEEVGSGGFILIFAQRRSKMTRPFFRVPEARGADRVWLFDLSTTSQTPGRDPAFAQRMGERNRRLFEQARALGGTRYPIGVLDFNPGDWVRHYGDMWPEFKRRKHRYDPSNIMTPGPGIF